MNTNLIIAGIILVLCGYGYYEHNRFIKARLELNTFVATTEALQAKQERDNAQAINNALTERDVANNRLRDSQSRTRSLRASITPADSERICYDSRAFDAEIQSFLGKIEKLLADGDQAVIDNKAWLESWPR